MGSIIARGTKLYAKIKSVEGKWERVATGHPDTPEGRRAVKEWLKKTERRIAEQRASPARGDDVMAPMLVERWAKEWRDHRARLGKDAKREYARLAIHVLPIVGHMLLADAAKTPVVIDLFTKIRTKADPDKGERLSSRTVHNIYGVWALMMRDAHLAGLIEHPPVALDERHLGRKVDKDPEWRATAMFSRDEVQTLISSSKIPWDRRVTYAIELLAGTRPGEAAALRWRHYDAAKQPLGELLVAKSYNARLDTTKGTKTDAIKHVPVHPTLAAILAAWRQRGWEQTMGRAPGPDDLIVPLPPADAAARTSKKGEPFRSDYYSRRRWVEEDEPALGWRHRRHYDTRATFITLALEDGADREVIETRITHTKRCTSAFDMYNRGLQWAATCRELAKLQIARVRDPHDNVIPFRAPEPGFGPNVVQSAETAAMSSTSGLRRRVSNPRPGG